MHGNPLKWSTMALLVLVELLVLAVPSVASAQVVTPPQLGSNLDIMRSRIGDERVQRQTEVDRLGGLLNNLSERVMVMERQQLRAAQLPSISMAEALATLEFAKLQLEDVEYQFERGEASKLQVARARLDLVRAEGQLDNAKSAHEERLMTLELDEIFAERQLFDLRKEKELAQRFAAKGYASSDSLRSLLLNEKLAMKQLQLVQVRLEAQRNSADQERGRALLDPDETASKIADGIANEIADEIAAARPDETKDEHETANRAPEAQSAD